MLLNLVGNAIKFTLKGHVLVRSRRLDHASVKIEVIDTGIGIPPDLQSQLFNKFTQADSSNSRKFGGTGLGLAISKQLVELAGGTIGVHSEPGKGSSFWFTHPLPSGPGGSLRAAASPFANRARVLLLEPNPARREILERQLAAWNARCQHAGSPEALQHILQDSSIPDAPFDIVLADYAIAGPDVAATAKQIHASPRTKSARLILVAPAALRCAAGTTVPVTGFDTILWKPLLRPEALAEALAKPSADHGRNEMGTAQNDRAIGAARRVLVVEQARTNQLLADRFLRRAGCDVDLADNGHAAADLAARRHYDLILVDWHLPELNGRETAAAIRAIEHSPARDPNSRRAPIIALMDELRPEFQSEASSAGIDDVLAKPLNPAAIDGLLSRWSA